jgi:3-oxoacyl-[acyl-carrier protein] reductase
MSGSNLFVIGASEGLGKALADHYKSSGRTVFAASRNINSSVDLFEVDISTGRGLTDFLSQTTIERSLVIVTAAALGPIGKVEDVTEDDWLKLLNLNLLGPIRVYKECQKIFGTTSKIIFFSGGGVGGERHQSRVVPYVVSKSALIALIEEIGREDRITRPLVTAVAPGSFPTRFTDPVKYAPVKLTGTALKEEFTNIQRQPFDISNLVEIVNFVDSNDGEFMDGRMISAVWDRPEHIVANARLSQSLGNSYGKLRRIDEDLFKDSSSK